MFVHAELEQPPSIIGRKSSGAGIHIPERSLMMGWMHYSNANGEMLGGNRCRRNEARASGICHRCSSDSQIGLPTVDRETPTIVRIQRRSEYKIWRELEAVWDHRNLAYIFPSSATCGISPSKIAAQRLKGWGASYLEHSRCTVMHASPRYGKRLRGPCFSLGRSVGGSGPPSIA